MKYTIKLPSVYQYGLKHAFNQADKASGMQMVDRNNKTFINGKWKGCQWTKAIANEPIRFN